MQKRGLVVISQGLELRREDVSENIEPISLPVNAKTIDLSVLESMRDLFALPSQAVTDVPQELTHVRKGRGELPLSVCQPPHVLVSETRNFAIYSEEFIVVPSRQIGIISSTGDVDLLKALALFLKSDFAFYCEFFLSSGFGIERDRSTLKALRRIPAPFATMTHDKIKEWSAFYDVLSKATRRAFQSLGLWEDVAVDAILPAGPVVSGELMKEMNDIVFRATGLGCDEQKLIHDFVHTQFSLNDGKLGAAAVKRPTKGDIDAYAKRLHIELDDYIRGELTGSHDVAVVHDDDSGMVRIRLVQGGTARGHVSVMRADAAEAATLRKCRQRIRQEKSQWVYFDRNLCVYNARQTCILKPMQRFHWTETQARVDAMDIISESIARREET
jgi:hypothetical protein